MIETGGVAKEGVGHTVGLELAGLGGVRGLEGGWGAQTHERDLS